ncbi:MAG: hypothetical protein DWQ07_06145 [Chloroflexi bacterium]|nr:MAG: hypothetical protein DWQ07_06145 [Chloroflexota bacterium]MBL1195990.1 hypothetical protein [Chloroflexota bacterium]NOH13284.1 hypothetical protein [Chloroflexota bacterium]
MLRKLILSLSLTLVSALAIGSPALAQEIPPDRPGQQRGFGQIIDLGDDWFVVENRAGTHTVFVNAETEYKYPDCAPASFAELKLRMWVAGSATPNDAGDLVADVVILTPDDFDPSDVRGRLVRGEVIAVSFSEETFTLNTADDHVVRIVTTLETNFYGGLSSFDDIKLGIHIIVQAQPSDVDPATAESLVAAGVASGTGQRPGAKRFAGLISAVNLDASTFTIDKRNGEQSTFLVDDETQFHSRDGVVLSLAEVEAGMAAVVGAELVDDGTLLAKGVAVGEADLLDAEKARGEVTTVGDASFTLTTRDGAVLTFSVTDTTRFVSRDPEFNGLEDIEIGMNLAVAYEGSPDATSLTALAVVAGAKLETDSDQ